MSWVKYVIGFLLFGAIGHLSGQEKETRYPLPLLGGKTYRIPANIDTAWVLKNSQYKEALKIAMRGKIDREKIILLEQKVGLQDQIRVEKDSLIALHNRGYIHFRDLWKETSVALEEAEIKASRRWRFFQVGFFVGVAATVGVTAYLRGIR